MKRRTLLAGVTSATSLLAGCSTGPLSGDSGPDPAERVDVAVESGFSKFDATFEVETVRGPTDDHPPRIGATFENASDRTRTYSFGAEAPLAPTPDEGAISALYLRAPDEDGYDADGCWQSSVDDWRSETVTVELDPGETVSNELDVFASQEVEVEEFCLPTGTGHFEQVVTRVPDDGPPTVDAVRFSLTLR